MSEDLPIRKLHRLPESVYASNGVYFVTICTDMRRRLFADVIETAPDTYEVRLNPYGEVVWKWILRIPERYALFLDAFSVMPNHVHLLLRVDRPVPAAEVEEPELYKAIGFMKMNVSKEMHRMGFPGKMWQRSFHDHVVRNQGEYEKIYDYVTYNHLKWASDRYFQR